MNCFPKEILNIIWEYLPNKSKVVLNKHYYEKYHYIVEECYKTPLKFYITYIRKILRTDLNYIFHVLLKDNYTKWKKIKSNKIIKDTKSNNFLDCLNQLCIEYNASKCRNEIFSYTKET
jgi:hypothetical protein